MGPSFGERDLLSLFSMWPPGAERALGGERRGSVTRWLPWSPGLRVTTHDCRSLSLFSRPCSHVFQSESPSEVGESGEF